MRDINELRKTNSKVDKLANSAPTQPTISLSALANESAAISIDATNGLTGVPEEDPNDRQAISINPRRKIRKHRSTIDPNSSDIHQVNPDDYIEKPKQAHMETPADRAMALLATHVQKKQEEYKQFVKDALEDDQINRAQVEAGLETVGDEIQYMPDELHVPMDESEKVISNIDYDEDVDDDVPMPDFDEEDDFQYEDAEDFDDLEVDTDLSIYNPFSMDYDEEDDDNDMIIDMDAEEIDDEESDFEELPIDDSEEEIIEDEESYDIPIDDNNEEEQPKTEKENIKQKQIIPEKNQTEDKSKKEDLIDVNEYDQILSKSINLKTSALDTPISEASSSDFEMNEEDLDEVSPVATEDGLLSAEEVTRIADIAEKNLKSEILKKIIQTGKALDTSQFVVSNKVINIKDALKHLPSVTQPERTAVWPLTYAGRPYKASALKGPDIAMMADSDNSESTNGFGLTIEQARIMFDHDVNPYRPSTLESWAKTIPFQDVENIFMALYVASLKGANYIPMFCLKRSCQHAYLSEDIPIDKLIKFNNDDVKKRFDDIKSMELTEENTGSYESIVNVINDKLAIGLKIPSIFTILYEYASLSTDFLNKYRTVISILQYVDYIYYIDSETSQFQPIGWKVYSGDHAKSFKSKIATYAKILKELDSTDFNILIALINSLVSKMTESRGITYEIPGDKCPKCGADIPPRSTNARGLVFVRQRLVELATTRLEK